MLRNIAVVASVVALGFSSVVALAGPQLNAPQQTGATVQRIAVEALPMPEALPPTIIPGPVTTQMPLSIVPDVPATPITLAQPVAVRHFGRRVVDPCCKPYSEQVLCVKDPCTGCEVYVCVCLPECCFGPDVSCRRTLLGGKVVSHDYGNGIKVNVRFQRDGDVVVNYFGA